MAANVGDDDAVGVYGDDIEAQLEQMRLNTIETLRKELGFANVDATQVDRAGMPTQVQSLANAAAGQTPETIFIGDNGRGLTNDAARLLAGRQNRINSDDSVVYSAEQHGDPTLPNKWALVGRKLAQQADSDTASNYGSSPDIAMTVVPNDAFEQGIIATALRKSDDYSMVGTNNNPMVKADALDHIVMGGPAPTYKWASMPDRAPGMAGTFEALPQTDNSNDVLLAAGAGFKMGGSSTGNTRNETSNYDNEWRRGNPQSADFVLPNDPASVALREYVDSPEECYAVPRLSLDDPNVLKAAQPILRNGGYADFSTGGVRVLLFNGKTSLVPVIRQSGQTFTDAALAASASQRLDAVVNGELYDAPKSALMYGAGGGAADPSSTTTQGEVLLNGKLIAGRSSPQTFYVSQTSGSNGNMAYDFGQGNPPLSSNVAFGGGIPLIVNGLDYGGRNLYSSGSAGGPLTGNPGSSTAYLTQRSNLGIADLEARPDTTGKVVLAHSPTNDALAVVVQADGAPNAMPIDGLRDRLHRSGFNNALAFDGSSSATLVENGRIQVAPAQYKNGTINVGIGIKRPAR